MKNLITIIFPASLVNRELDEIHCHKHRDTLYKYSIVKDPFRVKLLKKVEECDS